MLWFKSANIIILCRTKASPWFRLSEKHTKFEKNIPYGFDKSVLSKRQNHEEDFFKSCVLLKKSEL